MGFCILCVTDTPITYVVIMRIVKDYYLDHYSYISEERVKRPMEFAVGKEDETHNSDCVFCAGNETLTPQEIGRIDDGKGGWRMRWFPNKFNAVSPESEHAYGFQEVIVETPDPQKQLWDFSGDELAEIFGVYQNRIKELHKDKKIRYVSIFKNHGKESGASLLHSHTQVLATSVFPSRLTRKLRAIQELEHCPYCVMINEEKQSDRYIWENEEFIAFCPKAPRFAMEAWIVSKTHRGDFQEFSQSTLSNLTVLLKKFLLKLKTLNASYCFYFYYAPPGQDLHFHLELLPRLHKWAGFELSSDDYVIGTPPEAAARFYRGE